MADDEEGVARPAAGGSIVERDRGSSSRLRSFATATTASSKLRQVDRLRIGARQLRVEARGVGNVADQPVEAAHVVLDDRHQPLRELVGAGKRQGLDGAAQRGQRVLQLVRDVGGEALDGVDAVVERARHVAQRAGQMADLVRAVGEIGDLLRAIWCPGAPARRPRPAGGPARRWCRRATATARSSPARRRGRRAGWRSARRR